MATEITEDQNIIRQQGALCLIAEELRRDVGVFIKNWQGIQDDVEALSIRFELADTERLSINARMNSLDRMIASVRR